MINYETNKDFLAHYGVLGMKWGRRKQKKYADKANRQVKRHRHNAKNLKSMLDSNTDMDGQKLDKETRKAYKHEYNKSIEGAKHWVNTRKDILKMNLKEVNTKDIKNRFNKNKYKYGYYPF